MSPNEGVAGILNYEAEFFVTNEREIAFRKWMGAERPDVTLVRGPVRQGRGCGRGLSAAASRERRSRLRLCRLGRAGAEGPLGDQRRREVAADRHGRSRQRDRRRASRQGGPLKGIAAQRPYDQGAAAASAALLGLIGRPPPAWITSTGLKVTRENLREVLRGRLARASAAAMTASCGSPAGWVTPLGRRSGGSSFQREECGAVRLREANRRVKYLNNWTIVKST